MDSSTYTGSLMDMPISEIMGETSTSMESGTYTVNGKEFELKHYGVKGMKWGKRKPRYIPVGNARRAGNTAQSGSSSNSEAARKAARKSKAKRALKIGAAVAGTALAAYGTYKLAQHLQNKRSQSAMQKAQDYINNNVYRKVRDTKFTDGSREMDFVTRTGNKITTAGARGNVGKAVGKHNAEVVAKGRQMYKDATNTKLDRGLAKVVNAGDTVKAKAKSAANSAKNTATKAKNSVLDVVKPQYEQAVGRQYTDNSGMEWTEYVWKKKKRG